MKKLYFLLVGICFFNVVNAQIINFPDVNFKSMLLESNSVNFIAKDENGNNITIDLNLNREIEVSEALNVYQITIVRNTNRPYLVSLAGIENFTNLRKIMCVEQHLSQVDCSQLINLEEIDFSYNQLVNINLTGLMHLKKIKCYGNLLTSLNTTDLVSLEYLDCSSNKIPSINVSTCLNLQKLYCLYNNLSSLNVAGLSHLTEINCEDNHLTTLNLSGLLSLIDFSCRRNQLTSLNLPDSNNLKVLFCGGNLLTTFNLPNLTLLTTIDCSYNLLTSINLTNQINLVSLYCNNNSLTQLDVSHTNLSELYCEDNNIKSIDISNCSNMFRFTCSNNPNLTYLNLKNGNGTNYNYYMNKIPKLTYVCVDEEEYNDIYYRIYYYSSSSKFEINSYCSFVPGGAYYTIQGNTKLDTNNNGYDNSDDIYPNLNFSITDGINKGNFISDSSGNYSIPVQAGAHTITPNIENPNYFTVSPSSVNVTFPTQTSPFIQNFCITPKGVHNDLEVTILPTLPARPGFDASYKIIYKNKGNQTQSGSLNLSFNDAVLDFVSAIPATNNQVTDKLTWDYTNLKPFESREITVTLNVNSPMETPAVNIGDRLSFNALINPVTGDEKLVDNSSALRQSVVGSFDPNDKTCLEGDIITPSLIGKYVNYLIRFENTGTYPAQNIVVKDLIDLTKFDISTLVPTKASHDFVTKISDGNRVEFIFENINLPFDNTTNDGYIAFKIKTLPTLVVGDSFENEANIFFDYNFPVLTNKAKSTFKTLGTPDFEFSDYFSLYPNPANDILNIGTKNSIEVESIAVYDILGQIIIAIPDAKNVSNIDVSKLTAGNYFLKMSTNKGSSSVKFIKQ
jgi:Leucine-rich repeat (LRR) protein